VATTLPWGETLTVLMELGFPVNPFTLDDAGVGVLDTNILGGVLLADGVASLTQQVSISRGRQNQLAQFSAGTCAITLLNNDRRFDPTNEDSPYFDTATGKSGVQPRRKVTVRLGNDDIFVGRITDIDLSYGRGISTDLSTVVITAADDFVLLANTATTLARTPTEELSGARLNYLLNLAEIDFQGTTDIDAGTATLGTYQIDANTNALAYAQAITQSEQGFFFVARNGDLTFTDRATAGFAQSIGSFSDNQGSDIKYQALGISYGQEFLYNKVATTRETGSPQIANDAASQTEYGISTLSLDNLLLSNDAQAQDLADELLELYAEPTFRFEDMSLVVSSFSSGNRVICNQLELGDTITIERNYVSGNPTTVSKFQTVERLNRVITPNFHRLEVGMSEAYVIFPLLLDDITFGILDTDNALS
jgi:hypothetical protein